MDASDGSPKASNLIAVLLITRSRPGPKLVFHHPPVPQVPDGSSNSNHDPLAGDSSDSDNDEKDSGADGKRRRGASDSTVRHIGDAAVGFPNPLDSVLGHSVESIERLLNPGRWCEKKKFEVCFDGITFVGLPVFSKENGTWAARDEGEGGAVQQKPSTDPVPVSSLQKEDSIEGSGVDGQDQSPEKDLSSGIAGITITAPDTPAPSLPADFTHVPDSFDSHGIASLGTSMNSASTTSGTAAEQMTMFHVVFALSGNSGEGDLRTVDVYKHIAKKLSKALKYCQKRTNYVSAESRKLLAIRHRARVERTNTANLWTQFVSHSELAWALQEVYNRISANDIAGIRLDGMEMALQIPPKSSEHTVSPLSALLLLDDRETLIRALDDHRDASVLSYFIREATPTKSLAKQAAKLGIPEKTLVFLAQHLVKWRKARLIDPLHPRNIYIVHPRAPLRNLRALSEEYAKRFPALPSLESMLAMLGARPLKYGALIQSRDHRLPYMEILAWLVRHDLVTPLSTVGWLRLLDADKDNGEADRNELRPMAVSRLLGVRAGSESDDGSSVASDQTAFPTGVPQSSTSAPSGDISSDQAQDKSPLEDLDMIADPLNPSSMERVSLRNMEASIEDPDLRDRFPSLVPYFDGKHAFEDIAGREGLKRAKVEEWIGELERQGWLRSVRCLQEGL